MHQTPNLPGTGPVTDNPNPDNTQGSIPTEPGTGPSTGPTVVENKGGAVNPFGGAPTGGTGVENPSAPTSGTEGSLDFRCSDINPSCSWEAHGRNENDLRTQIEQHGREKHNIRDFSEDIWNRVRSTFQRRAA
jgi:predicted small metal-binding protein